MEYKLIFPKFFTKDENKLRRYIIIKFEVPTLKVFFKSQVKPLEQITNLLLTTRYYYLYL